PVLAGYLEGWDAMKRFLILVSGLALLFDSPVRGQDLAEASGRRGDWPNWRGPNHDGISRERGLAKSWPAQGPKVVWKADLPGGYSSVVVAHGRLITLSKEKNEDLVLC